MKIETCGSNLTIDENIRRFVRHRVEFALSSRTEYIDSVLVHLFDIDNPDNSEEKRCLVQVRLHGLPDVWVKISDANLYVAIHRAVDRAGWTVARRIMRQHRLVIASLSSEGYLNLGREAGRAA